MSNLVKEVTDDPMYKALHAFVIPTPDRFNVDWGDAPLANREKLRAASIAVSRRGKPAVSAGAPHE